MFTKLFDIEGGGGVDGGELDGGTRDWTRTGESKSTTFDSIGTGQLARVSFCPARSLLLVHSVKEWVKSTPRWAGFTIGLQEVVYYCGERRRPMAATLTVRCANRREVRKLQERPALHSLPFPHSGGAGPKQV